MKTVCKLRMKARGGFGYQSPQKTDGGGVFLLVQCQKSVQVLR